MRVSIPLYTQRHPAELHHDASIHKTYGTRCFASELQVTHGLVLIILPVTMVYRIQSFYLFARRFHINSLFLGWWAWPWWPRPRVYLASDTRLVSPDLVSLAICLSVAPSSRSRLIAADLSKLEVF